MKRMRPPLILVLLLAGCLGDPATELSAEHPLVMTSYAYDGRGISNATGSLELKVDAASNSGRIVASARDAFHLYEVEWLSFGGRAAFQSGGIATGLDMWGDSGNGSAVFPRMHCYVAAFGQAESRIDGRLEKDPSNLQDRLDAILFVTQGRFRDPETLRVEDAQKLAPYDPKEPQDVYVNAIGAQAVLLLFTERGELVRQYDYQDVRVLHA